MPLERRATNSAVPIIQSSPGRHRGHGQLGQVQRSLSTRPGRRRCLRRPLLCRQVEPLSSPYVGGTNKAECVRLAPTGPARTGSASSASPLRLGSTRRSSRRARLGHVLGGLRCSPGACARRTPPSPNCSAAAAATPSIGRLSHRWHRGGDGAAAHALDFPLARAEQRRPGSWPASRPLGAAANGAAESSSPTTKSALASPRSPSRGLVLGPRAPPYA
jgi:hypothetical protein